MFSCREQMSASTWRLLLRAKPAPWCALAATISMLHLPWTPDALTPGIVPPLPGLKASWDFGLSPWLFDANPQALSCPGTLPGVVEISVTT